MSSSNHCSRHNLVNLEGLRECDESEAAHGHRGLQGIAKSGVANSCIRFEQDGERRPVVFIDEAGLPEEKVESLKAIHYWIDQGASRFLAHS